MNKKGFSIIEVVVSFSLVVIILASLTTIVINYRDKNIDEDTKSKLLDFKNTITKIVYDDIVRGKYVRLSRCVDDNFCVNFYDASNNVYPLRVITINEDSGVNKKGIYIEYLGNRYMLVDSNVNKSYYTNGIQKEEVLSTILEFVFQIDDDNKLYSVVIPVYHYGLDLQYDIQLAIS